jgi:hypothetical protein
MLYISLFPSEHLDATVWKLLKAVEFQTYIAHKAGFIPTTAGDGAMASGFPPHPWNQS